ncbi:ATP-binding cassette domain-containing protein [Nocardioides convexus]|uniref:ATP-binding cassette domain-containing protein n=1 Tax=Nocardioides convexus TaxID=2712224 RepID=UPI0024186B43|nr:ATP-binding cassette domain-containing protein [Nocardioides convexus]
MGAEFHAAAEGAATFETAHALLARPASSTVDRPAPPHAPLVLERVGVTREGRNVPAVHDVSALLLPRGITAVTGPSGCGKSTLLAAIAGLVPHDGAVLSGGEPVGGPRWQAQVAWLPQQPRFVEGSIADNLRLARPDATGDQALARAARGRPRGPGTSAPVRPRDPPRGGRSDPVRR